MYSKLPQGDFLLLLHLKPGTAEESVTCNFQAHELAKAPLYEAISYVWGEKVKFCRSQRVFTGP